MAAAAPWATAVRRLFTDDPGPDHEGATFLVREEGTDRLLMIVVGEDDEPTPVTQGVMDDWEYLFA